MRRDIYVQQIHRKTSSKWYRLSVIKHLTSNTYIYMPIRGLNIMNFDIFYRTLYIEFLL